MGFEPTTSDLEGQHSGLWVTPALLLIYTIFLRPCIIRFNFFLGFLPPLDLLHLDDSIVLFVTFIIMIAIFVSLSHNSHSKVNNSYASGNKEVFPFPSRSAYPRNHWYNPLELLKDFFRQTRLKYNQLRSSEFHHGSHKLGISSLNLCKHFTINSVSYIYAECKRFLDMQK